MSEPVPLINIWGEKIALGPLRRDLLPLYTRWVNDFEVITTLGLPPMAVIAESEQEWFDSAVKSKDTAHFTIYVRETMQPIGTTSLNGINHKNQRAIFGIMIGEKGEWSKGYGTETARLLLDYGFNRLGLHSINLTVFATNQGGIKAYERAGYKLAGRLRDGVRSGNEFIDIIYMDCLASEFHR